MIFFVKCRFTHTPDDPWWFNDAMMFLCNKNLNEFLGQYGKITHRTYGEECASRHHIHIHYRLETVKGSKKLPSVIHQTFLYYLKKKGFKKKPPTKSSSITVEEKEDEPGRIMRYPLKQDNKHYDCCFGYTKAELNALHSRANEEYKIAIKAQQNREAKKDKEEKTWNDLCAYLDKNLNKWDLENKELSEKVMKTTIKIYQYYQEHRGSRVSRNLRDKALRYLMITNPFTPSELEDIYYFYYRII